VINQPRSTVHTASEAFISIPAMNVIRVTHSRQQDRPYPQRLLNGIMDEVNSNITSEHIHKVMMRVTREIMRENNARRARQGRKRRS
jgi:hypothetical protein